MQCRQVRDGGRQRETSDRVYTLAERTEMDTRDLSLSLFSLPPFLLLCTVCFIMMSPKTIKPTTKADPSTASITYRETEERQRETSDTQTNGWTRGVR